MKNIIAYFCYFIPSIINQRQIKEDSSGFHDNAKWSKMWSRDEEHQIYFHKKTARAMPPFQQQSVMMFVLAGLGYIKWNTKSVWMNQNWLPVSTIQRRTESQSIKQKIKTSIYDSC